MGLNAFFAFTIVGTLGYSWQQALGAVFISGVIFYHHDHRHPQLAIAGIPRCAPPYRRHRAVSGHRPQFGHRGGPPATKIAWAPTEPGAVRHSGVLLIAALDALRVGAILIGMSPCCRWCYRHNGFGNRRRAPRPHLPTRHHGRPAGRFRSCDSGAGTGEASMPPADRRPSGPISSPKTIPGAQPRPLFRQHGHRHQVAAGHQHNGICGKRRRRAGRRPYPHRVTVVLFLLALFFRRWPVRFRLTPPLRHCCMWRASCYARSRDRLGRCHGSHARRVATGHAVHLLDCERAGVRSSTMWFSSSAPSRTRRASTCFVVAVLRVKFAFFAE